MNWLKVLIWRWLELDRIDARIRDLERHFVTKRDERGQAIETLADVPLEHRKTREVRFRGMSMAQRREWLERTDGGRSV